MRDQLHCLGGSDYNLKFLQSDRDKSLLQCWRIAYALATMNSFDCCLDYCSSLLGFLFGQYSLYSRHFKWCAQIAYFKASFQVCPQLVLINELIWGCLHSITRASTCKPEIQGLSEDSTLSQRNCTWAPSLLLGVRTGQLKFPQASAAAYHALPLMVTTDKLLERKRLTSLSGML